MSYSPKEDLHGAILRRATIHPLKQKRVIEDKRMYVLYREVKMQFKE